ncbi:Cell division protein FtsI/penicillin-binding protein 2 [Thermostaphylospora chromogena]|uniref:Cell division protein FtsI/penicillin-binding protein 2 n=1 Tax=Thermostaphylospora chromogena TaxID=35622 RepID=A0A1H1EP15_9ACTN|nr:Cell division protein FtsI/penicillin-binding protein 2 [Thermostaphylospora chromogena]
MRSVPGRRRIAAAALALAATAPLLTGCLQEASPHDAVRDFLVGWQSGDHMLAARRTDGDPAEVAKAIGDVRLDLDAASFRFQVTGITSEGDTAEARYRAEVDLGENNPLWVYDGVLPLHLVDGQWKVRWSPSVLHPKLGPGQRLAVEPTSGGRQPILDREDDPLQTNAVLYVAGVTPATVDDPQKVCAELAKVTGFAQDRLFSRVRSAPPKTFVPLVTFGRQKFAELRAELEAIDGIEIDQQEQPVAPAAPKQIVGTVSAVTPETEQQLGGPQRAGDSIGLDGLQKAYQDRLTGATGTKVVTIDLKTGETVTKLAEWPGRANAPVSTTIDSRLQRAAESAVSATRRSALVAVKPATGEILAVSTKGMHQVKDALAGKFPAGSAFSVVAADALLKSGVKTTQKLPCPQSRSVGGARFQLTREASSRTLSFRRSFTEGCVTALAALARRVEASSLVASATAYGIGSEWTLPLSSYSGTMPGMRSDAAKAQAIVGQNVKVSPLAMALVAGAVASGTWHPPVLVTSPAQPLPSDDGETVVRQPDPVRLNADTVKTLRSLMRAGVTSGSAAAAAATTGAPVHGIVSAPVDGRSWFIGWRGEVAVAVLVEGGDPAAVAGAFFRYATAAS